MSWKPIVSAANAATKFTSRNAGTILTVTSIVGVCVTAFKTGEASIKASKVIEEMNYTAKEPPTTKEKVKAVAPLYIGPAIYCGITISSIIFTRKVYIRRQAALAAAYSLADARYKEYREKVTEALGERKEEKLHSEIAEKKIRANPPDQNGLNIIHTGEGDVLFCDSLTMRYFYSSYEAVERARLEISADVQDDNYVSLNQLYSALGIPQTTLGDLLGWNIWQLDRAETKKTIPLYTGRTIQTPTPEQMPCTMIDYEVEPMFDYDHNY